MTGLIFYSIDLRLKNILSGQNMVHLGSIYNTFHIFILYILYIDSEFNTFNALKKLFGGPLKA